MFGRRTRALFTQVPRRRGVLGGPFAASCIAPQSYRLRGGPGARYKPVPKRRIKRLRTCLRAVLHSLK